MVASKILRMARVPAGAERSIDVRPGISAYPAVPREREHVRHGQNVERERFADEILLAGLLIGRNAFEQLGIFLFHVIGKRERGAVGGADVRILRDIGGHEQQEIEGDILRRGIGGNIRRAERAERHRDAARLQSFCNRAP